MRYDMTIITDTETDVQVALGHIKDMAGTVKEQKSLGQKQFTYPIGKKLEGVYTAFLIDVPSENVVQLNRELSIDPKIIRHLLIGTKATELPKPYEARKYVEKTDATDTDKATGPSSKGVAKTTPEKIEKKKTVKESAADAAKRQEVLNKELEQILES